MALVLPANEVWGKVIFLHLFVILFTGGVPGLGGCLVLGGAWSQGGAWSWGVPGPRGVPGLGCVPGPGGVWSGGAWGRPPRDGFCCGQYASYWNAFLLVIKLSFIRLISSCRLYQVNMTKVTEMTLRK